MKTIKEVRVGEKFKYGGIEWVKLDDAHGCALVLTENKRAYSTFDENDINDWVGSLCVLENETFVEAEE